MAVVSATYFHLRRRYTLPFLLLTLAIQRQVARSPGFRGGRLLAGGDGTYWTVTAWEDQAALKAFRGRGRHREGMHRTPRWALAFRSTRWTQEHATDADLPGWDEAARRIGVPAPRRQRHSVIRARSTTRATRAAPTT